MLNQFDWSLHEEQLIQNSASSLICCYKDFYTKGFQQPDSKKLLIAQKIFTQILSSYANSRSFVKLSQLLLQTSFAITAIKDSELYYMSELEKSRTGKGCYLANFQCKKNILLQAPHRFSDQGTGGLVMTAMQTGWFKAAAFNNVTRQTYDLVHTADNYMMTFTKAFMAAYPDALVVQLHGFDADNHKNKILKQADIVISAGGKKTKSIAKLHKLLFQSISKQTYLYPDHTETKTLGATKNTIGQWINAKHSGQFVHIELGTALRQKLLKNIELQNKFFSCVSMLL